jgi:uncharacterized membrane protein
LLNIYGRTMRNESALASLATLGLADSIAVALRQTGVIEKLPDVSWRGFDANRVTTSPEAYPFGIPDGIPATALYVTEIALAAAVVKRPRSRFLRGLLGLAVGVGAIGAAYYSYQMAFVEKRVCLYCVTAIAANAAMVPFALRLVRGRDV